MPKTFDDAADQRDRICTRAFARFDAATESTIADARAGRIMAAGEGNIPAPGDAAPDLRTAVLSCEFDLGM